MTSKPQKIPQSSGVYFFKDSRGRVLYIGKAANLKNRLASYFQKGPRDPRIKMMLEQAARVDWRETGSEVEALILESQLIKKQRPKFNILMRDDKQYFYVGFTEEKFSRLLVTHQPLKAYSVERRAYRKYRKTLNAKRYPLDADFIGPFTDGSALKATLKLLRRIFPYCTCKQKHNNYCLNYHIGKCPGFCCLKNVESQIKNKELRIYRNNIQTIKAILSGQKPSAIKKIEKEMNQAAQKGDFEKAADIRDKLAKLKKIFENAKVIKETGGRQTALNQVKKLFKLSVLPTRIEGYDISNIQGQFAVGSMVVFTEGQPDKAQYRKFKISLEGKANDIAMLREVLTRRFKHPEWPQPDLIIVDGGKGQLNVIGSVISNSKFLISKEITIVALTKDERHRGSHIFTSGRKTPLALKDLPFSVSALIQHVDAEAHRFAISYYRKVHRRSSMA